MFASVLQLVGLVVVVACATAVSLLAGGVALGGAIVFIGLALDGD